MFGIPAIPFQRELTLGLFAMPAPRKLIRTSKIEIYDTDYCAMKNNHEENHLAMCQEISFTQASTIEGRLEKLIVFKPTMMMVSKTKRVKHSRQTSQSKRYPSPYYLKCLSFKFWSCVGFSHYEDSLRYPK